MTGIFLPVPSPVHIAPSHPAGYKLTCRDTSASDVAGSDDHSMGKAIGIDLGTTNSCAACVLEGRPTLLTFPNGARSIPSVFAIDKEGKRLVGEEALAQAAANPMGTITASKRLIGNTFDSSSVEQMQQVFTYELVEGAESEVMVKVAEQVLTLEQVSAAILRRVRDAAEEVLDQEVTHAVITVPAYFNDRQRQAVRSAGKLAGLHVLRVLNEPTAAALSYGLGRTLQQRIAVYDLGGGTFDVSVIDINGQMFEVVATGGDTFLGGVDFDDRLMQFVLQSFVEETGIDVSYDRTAVRRIRDAAEQAKILLSSKRKARVYLPAVTSEDGEVVDLDMIITRDQLEALTGDLVDRSLRICREILTDASSNSDRKLDDLLIVGAQSRMPLVRRALTKFLGRKPMAKIDPEEAIALGAAIMAHSLSASAGDDEKVTLLDVLPMAIGVAKPNGLMHPLFKRNHTLPCSKTLMLTTHEAGQRSIILRLYQGDASKASANASLGTFVFSGLRDAPKGDVRVEITLHIDSEGIVNLSARDTDTNQSVESRLKLGAPKRTESKKRKRKVATPEPAEEPAVKKKPVRKKRKPKKRTTKAAAARKQKRDVPEAEAPATNEKKRTVKKKPMRKRRKSTSKAKGSGSASKTSPKPRKTKRSSADAVPRPSFAPVRSRAGWWKKLKQRWRGDSD